MTYLGLSNKQICQSSLVCALSLLPHCLVLFFASGSEVRVEPERTQSEPRANPERTQSEGRVEAWCVEWCEKLWCDILGRLRSCLNLIDEFYYGHGRAVFFFFSIAQWGSIVIEKRRKRCRSCALRKTLN